MNAGMIRFGGILVFVSLALGIAAVVAIIAMQGQLGPTLTTTLQVGGTALFIYVLWSTKSLFNTQNHRGADLPIAGIVVLALINLALGIVDGDAMNRVVTEDGKLGPVSTLAAVSMGISLVSVVLVIWFAISTIRFGKRVGSGVWKAVGILYIVAYAVFAAALPVLFLSAAQGMEGLSGLMQGLIVVAGLAAFGGGLAMIASWICQGIGLIAGSRMPVTGAARS